MKLKIGTYARLWLIGEPLDTTDDSRITTDGFVMDHLSHWSRHLSLLSPCNLSASETWRPEWRSNQSAARGSDQHSNATTLHREASTALQASKGLCRVFHTMKTFIRWALASASSTPSPSQQFKQFEHLVGGEWQVAVQRKSAYPSWAEAASSLARRKIPSRLFLGDTTKQSEIKIVENVFFFAQPQSNMQAKLVFIRDVVFFPHPRVTHCTPQLMLLVESQNRSVVALLRAVHVGRPSWVHAFRRTDTGCRTRSSGRPFGGRRRAAANSRQLIGESSILFVTHRDICATP